MSTDLSIVRDAPKPEKPAGVTAPRVRWHLQGTKWVAYWEAAQELVKAGFLPRTQRLWSGAEPTLEDWHLIASECRRYESQMRTWKANSHHRDTAPEADPEGPWPINWRPTPLVSPPTVNWDLVPLTMDEWLGREADQHRLRVRQHDWWSLHDGRRLRRLRQVLPLPAH